jgi:hypothetical protein
MDFELSSEQKTLVENAREFAGREIIPFRRELEQAHEFPVEIMRKMAKAGFLSLTIPREYGGNYHDPVAYALAMQIISQADAGVSVAMSVTNMVAEVIVRFGKEEQKKKYLPRIASGEIIAGSFGLTEPNAGSNPVQMRTRAIENEPGIFTINGEKIFITSGDHAGVIVLFAKTDPEKAHHGITAFLLDGETQGLSIGKKEEKLGLWASSTVSLILEDVKAESSTILGNRGDGFKIAMSALDSGRIGIASQATGIAEAALHELLQYYKNSGDGGIKLDDEGFQFEIADLFTKLEACKLMIYQAAWRKMTGQPFTREASMAKYFATEMSNRIVSTVVRLAGWKGVSENHLFEKFLRDVKVTTIYEGTSEIQKIVIARKILQQVIKK